LKGNLKKKKTRNTIYRHPFLKGKRKFLKRRSTYRYPFS